jgi:transcriptional regulator with XRE-family HTH domain
MQPDDFRSWRKALGWKQKDAAEKLGLKKRVIQYYEKGDRDGKAIEIPKTVELACLALTLGFESYDGQAMPRAKNAPAPRPAAAAAAEAPARRSPKPADPAE